MILLRFACSITTDQDEVIITGGDETRTTVSVYNINGWVEDLATINFGRYFHACGQYKSQDGKTVSNEDSVRGSPFFEHFPCLTNPDQT